MDKRELERLQAMWRQRNSRKNNWVGLRLDDSDEETLVYLTDMLQLPRTVVLREAVRSYAASLTKNVRN